MSLIEVALMIEGQAGLTWPRWQRIAERAEDLGFAGLYRSDHFTNADPPDQESLELWVSLTWLASHSQRIEFGPLVSPVSFRHPAITARMAAAVDDLSGGRLQLGLGAGWQEREHTNFGLELLDMERRFKRFTDALEVIFQLLHSNEPVDFDGAYYHLQDAILLPRPQRPGGPPIVIGGNGRRRTLPLVARFADEWNAVYVPAKEFRSLSEELDRLLTAAGRSLDEVRRTLMAGIVFGRDRSEVTRKVDIRTKGRKLPHELRAKGVLVGDAAELRSQLAELEEAGVQRVMLQWLDLDDLPGIEALAAGILV